MHNRSPVSVSLHGYIALLVLEIEPWSLMMATTVCHPDVCVGLGWMPPNIINSDILPLLSGIIFAWPADLAHDLACLDEATAVM